MSSVSNRVGIALGSNVGDRLRFLQFARDRVVAGHDGDSPFRQSSVYETTPVGCPAQSPNFYNAALEIHSASSPEELLVFLRAVERELGRRADHPRNAARTIDLDVLYFGGRSIEQPGLSVPHPRMIEREFVLRPLAEIAPDLRLPGVNATVEQLLANLPKSGEVKKIFEQW